MDINYSSEKFESQYTYCGNDLGCICTGNETRFRVWAPTAERVTIRFYRNAIPAPNELYTEFPMLRAQCGTWVYCKSRCLQGLFYTYHAVFDDHEVDACDPYGKAVGVNGIRSAVLDLSGTNPDNWDYDYYNGTVHSISDAVIYETHIRDLTMDTASGVKPKGKYLSLCVEGTHTKNGNSTVLSHIMELGVTHIQLLPFYDFGSIDESNPKSRKYNWGYDPVHFNVPEGSYSSNPFTPGIRIRELKLLIQTLHRNGLGIIMDVVYNHVYRSEDFSINQLIPMYFSRTNKTGRYSNATGCGNDTASERTMVRKFIVDSVNYWADEYHIDGFRFDLAGILDIETIKEVIATVHQKHPHVLFYGEGWNMPTNPTKEGIHLANQQNAAQLRDFSFFNDSIRDTLRGTVFNPHERGFVSGATWCKEELSKAFRGCPDWAVAPSQSINYVSCHDNHTLYDRIAIPLADCSEEDLIRRNLLAAAFVFLSQGVPFFQAGEELLKSKRTTGGNFIHNSYRSTDIINSVKWSRKDTVIGKKVFEYYKGLIQIRKRFSILRYATKEAVNQHIFDYTTNNDRTVAFRIMDSSFDCIILFHADWQPNTITLPQGKWYSIIDEDKAGLTPIGKYENWVTVPPACTFMLIKE